MFVDVARCKMFFSPCGGDDFKRAREDIFVMDYILLTFMLNIYYAYECCAL